MEELKSKVANLIEEYFDKKIGNVYWFYDIGAENTAHQLIKECIKDVAYELDGYERDIDNHLCELNQMYEKERKQEDRIAYIEDYMVN